MRPLAGPCMRASVVEHGCVCRFTSRPSARRRADGLVWSADWRCRLLWSSWRPCAIRSQHCTPDRQRQATLAARGCQTAQHDAAANLGSTTTNGRVLATKEGMGSSPQPQPQPQPHGGQIMICSPGGGAVAVGSGRVWPEGGVWSQRAAADARWRVTPVTPAARSGTPAGRHSKPHAHRAAARQGFGGTGGAAW